MFLGKFEQIKEMETLEHAIGFIFPRSGFNKEAEGYCRKREIAFSEDEGWLETDR